MYNWVILNIHDEMGQYRKYMYCKRTVYKQLILFYRNKFYILY